MNDQDRDDLAQRIIHARQAIVGAAESANRDPSGITIVAVSKTVGREVIDVAYDFGLRHFGENRVQDAQAKFHPPLPSDASLHLIGQLQTNKAKSAAALFGLIESVDRPSLVEALEKAAASLQLSLPVLIQVNVAGEAQKAGCDPADASVLAETIALAPHLTLRGLMTIAPLAADPEAVRPVFVGLHDLRDRLQQRFPDADFGILSMGMTNDYQIAIAEGATHVRIGRALFGG